VDAARGGVGATLVAAALAEGWLDSGKSVCVVDGDIFSQDLTRFLQVRPYVNEPLRLLLDCQRVVTAETVAECAFPVWRDESRFKCVPPPVATDEALLSSSQACRTFVGVLEVLQSQYQIVVVDAAPIVAGCRQALYQSADEVVLVANRDPAGAFANRQAVSLIGGYLRPAAQLTTVINQNSKIQASLSIVRQQVLVHNDVPARTFVFPYSMQGARWACSGRTAFPSLKRSIKPMLGDSDAAAQGGIAAALTAVLSSARRLVPRKRAAKSGEVSANSRGHEVGAMALLPVVRTAQSFEEVAAEDALVSKAVVSG
jgi:MinD-like ATPase involved in chromosome partitioning or flagellar assembly